MKLTRREAAVRGMVGKPQPRPHLRTQLLSRGGNHLFLPCYLLRHLPNVFENLIPRPLISDDLLPAAEFGRLLV